MGQPLAGEASGAGEAQQVVAAAGAAAGAAQHLRPIP